MKHIPINARRGGAKAKWYPNKKGKLLISSADKLIQKNKDKFMSEALEYEIK